MNKIVYILPLLIAATCQEQPIPDIPRPKIQECAILPTYVKCDSLPSPDNRCVFDNGVYRCESDYVWGHLSTQPKDKRAMMDYIDALEKALINCRSSL